MVGTARCSLGLRPVVVGVLLALGTVGGQQSGMGGMQGNMGGIGGPPTMMQQQEGGWGRIQGGAGDLGGQPVAAGAAGAAVAPGGMGWGARRGTALPNSGGLDFAPGQGPRVP